MADPSPSINSIEATTSSLDALKAFRLGEAQRARGSDVTAIPFYRRAIELDPNFALAYARLGAAYWNLRERELSAGYQRQAFEKRRRVSERERFYLAARYYENVTGELDKTIEDHMLCAQTYPRDWSPHNSLAAQYIEIGQFDKALLEAREAVRRGPSEAFAYSNLAWALAGSHRLEEAKAICRQAIERKFDSVNTHLILYHIAFRQRDAAAMEREIAWARGKPREHDMLAAEAGVAAAAGRIEQARQISRRSVDQALSANLHEWAALELAWLAFLEVSLGDHPQAVKQASAALELSHGPDTVWLAATALALAGNVTQAEKLAADLAHRFPAHTLVSRRAVPTIRAAVAIRHGKPAQAVELLRAATPYDGGIGLSSYIRALASLRAGQGAEAAAEFQGVQDGGLGPVVLLLRPLAQLGLARAFGLSGDVSKRRQAYQDFFESWKDAAPTLPLLRQARQEYEKP